MSDPNRPPLSPAAQAVMDHFLADVEISLEHGLAAALRAAAGEVVPKTPPPKFAPHYEEGIWDGKDDAREQLLAIAAELEGATRDPLEPNDLSHLSDAEFQALAPQGYHGV